MTLRKAAQMALEALELMDRVMQRSQLTDAAITALRAALAEPVQEQEPVAWMTFTPDGEEDDIWYSEPDEHLIDGWSYKPLYLAPPQRKPLTDEEIGSICAPLGFAQLSPVEVARAIEAAHGIKGGSDGS